MARRTLFLSLLLLCASAAVAQTTTPDAATPSQTTQPAPEAPQPPQPAADATQQPAPAAPEPDAKQHLTTKQKHTPVPAAELHNPSLWHDPGNIAALDLFYGQGGRAGMPVAPFTFEEEIRHDSTPKFDIHDANGNKWRVKLGQEAKPEVAASRLLWAMGFYVADDYNIPSADIHNLHLHRGGKYIDGDHITFARFSRKPDKQKKIGSWKWAENPFTGTREFNGLRVMMALLNSWDLKDENNSIYRDKKSGQDLFLVTDIGATFGTSGLHFDNRLSKARPGAFAKSKFITRADRAEISFADPSTPNGLELETLGIASRQYLRRVHMEWIGQHIPRDDVRWITSMLTQLTHQQLVDAFRAANFPPGEIDLYVQAIESRIAELKAL